ncbi:MAG TPA: hypothetical protein VKA86_11205 [Candidatus Krumholzibacteria bacterium]|nr:hypothetical protein [Candidatus Krumholzibacteria bacterium]
MRFDPDLLVRGDDVERAALALFGAPLRERPALSHVAAVWSPDDRHRHVLRIDPRGPRSDTDRFVLGLGRARADAIVTTGAILRAEPTLRFDLRGPGAGALMRWRVDVHELGPPIVLILTHGALDFDHPALKGPARVVLYVPDDRVDFVRKRLTSFRWITVCGDETPSLERALDWLRRERECASISIEAGPSTASPLYEPEGAVDELLLSRWTGDRLDEDLIAGDLPDDTTLRHTMERVHASPVDDQGWVFERWVRRREGSGS